MNQLLVVADLRVVLVAVDDVVMRESSRGATRVLCSAGLALAK